MNWEERRNIRKLKSKTIARGLVLLGIMLIAGISTGIILAALEDMNKVSQVLEMYKPPLPSILYDRHGKEITRFYSDEKRELIEFDRIPDYLVSALVLWEDAAFFNHQGFNPLATMRAAFNHLMRKPIAGGASTITQQLAGTIFCDRRDISINRKLKELWYSFQIEKGYTKNEILTLYLNHIPFGRGTNGVESASMYYFSKHIEDISIAEAASLVTLISNPEGYNFLRFPKNHRRKQIAVLNKLVKTGVVGRTEADESLKEFWLDRKSQLTSSAGAYFKRQDLAPYFSEYIRQHIEKEFPDIDIYRDGLIIHTTLDLDLQQKADKLVKDKIKKQEDIAGRANQAYLNYIKNNIIDSLDLLSYLFSLKDINITAKKTQKQGKLAYIKEINSFLHLSSIFFSDRVLENVAQKAYFSKEKIFETKVEGALIAFEVKTGKILSMVGGREFDKTNEFNRAVQAFRQPGSTFKPFLYSAALDSGVWTTASTVLDAPRAFMIDPDNPDDVYTPYNYNGRYHGRLRLRQALAKSLNIPSIYIANSIGIKSIQDHAARIIGLNSQSVIERKLPHYLTLALGTAALSPMEVATGFAVFANQGKRIFPYGILYIEDRNGKIIYNQASELKNYYLKNNKKLQVVSPQNAYIVTNMLQSTLQNGTLAWLKRLFPLSFPLAGKTGTTQLWSDAWTVGYSPEVITAVWFGMDQSNQTMGNNQNGSVVAGPVWREYMEEYHKNRPIQDFVKPPGLINTSVCAVSGLLPSNDCEKIITEIFLPNTTPTHVCKECLQKRNQDYITLKKLDTFVDKSNINDSYFSSKIPSSLKVDRSLLVDDILIDKKPSEEKNFDPDLETPPAELDDSSQPPQDIILLPGNNSINN